MWGKRSTLNVAQNNVEHNNTAHNKRQQLNTNKHSAQKEK